MAAFLTGKVLNQLMGDMSEAEFSKLIDVPKATINRLLSGRTPDPRIGTLAPIAQYFDISIDQLLGLSPLPENVPLHGLNKVACKVLSMPFLEFNKIHLYFKKKYTVQEYIEISTTQNHSLNENSYVTEVIATAMMPKFQEKSFLLVNPDLDPSHEDYVIFYDKSEQSVLFRQYICEGNKKYLCAIHSGFKAIEVSSTSLFLGVVVESRIFLK